MKLRLMVTTGLMAMTLWPAAAFADNNWYVTGAVGVGAGGEIDVKYYFIPDAKIQPVANWRFMAGGGYDFANNWRVQLDYTNRFNQYGSIANAGQIGNSDFRNQALVLSGIWDFWQGESVGAYAGAGLGWARARYSVIHENPAAPNGSEGVKRAKSGIAGHLMGGLNFRITPALSADVEYRYFLQGEDINLAYTGGEMQVEQYDSHDVFFGLRYAFLPPAAPPAPPQAAAPPRAPSCSDVPFTVYFEWDKYDLNNEARQVVDTAINQLASCRVVTIEIEGHTDRSGPEDYNQALSERRAQTVHDEFVSRGIPASGIMTQAFGETMPAVDTPDGVREPLNRRAYVVIRVAGGAPST